MKARALTFAGIAVLAVVATMVVQTAANAKNPVAKPVTQAAAVLDLPFPASSETVFHAVTPVRILDTRSSLGGHLGDITSAAPFNLQVTGALSVGTIVPTGATAVAFNVTVTNPTVQSYLKIWPTGAAEPTVSTLNYNAGETLANFATVKLSSGGQIRIKPGAGGTDVLIDIAGYYSKSTAWGVQGYIGWATGSDSGIGMSHSNNGQSITFSHNSTGNNTFTFNGADIAAFIGAEANIQVSVAGVNTNIVCETIAGSSGDDVNVTVDCNYADTLDPANPFLYIQVTG